MLEFKKFEKDSYAHLKPYFMSELKYQAKTGVRMCNYAPGTILMWRDHYKTEYATIDNSSVIFSSVFEDNIRSYYYPIGKGKKAALKTLAKHIKETGGCGVISGVGEGMVSSVAKEMLVGEAYAYRDWADYVYLKSEFENPTGRKHHKRKNLINRFTKDYPRAKLVMIDEDNINIAREYYIDYSKRNPESSSVDDAEFKATIDILSDFNYDIFFGGII